MLSYKFVLNLLASWQSITCSQWTLDKLGSTGWHSDQCETMVNSAIP